MSDAEHANNGAPLQGSAPPDTGLPELAVLGPARRSSLASWVRRFVWNLLPNRLLFNPVFWKDSAISARKKGTFAFRGVYMLLLLLVVGIAVATADENYWYSGAVARLEAGAQLAWMLTQTIQWTQLFILLLAGPILASGAIANERTNRSLESLYTTPLTNSQIVWGKITARMGYIFIVALLPLPILLMLRALGGIDATTTLLQTVIIMTGTTLTTSMGMFFSVHAKKPWRAVMSVVSLLVVYHLLLAFVPILFAIMSANTMNLPDWLIQWCSMLSPIISFTSISFWDTFGQQSGVFQTDQLGVCLQAVAAQLGMSLVFGSLAVLRLKRAAKPSRVRRISNRRSKQAVASPPGADSPAPTANEAIVPVSEGMTAVRRRRKHRRRTKGSLVVWDHPVFWRDWRQPVIELPKLGILSVLLSILILFGIGWILWVELPDGTRIYQSVLVYGILYMVCSLMLLIAASMRTATLIAQERATRTWESLRTTPMSPWSIVVQKYFGSMAKPFCQAGALLLVMIVPVLLGQMRWTVVPFLGMTLFAAMAFLAATGMVFGSIFRKGMLAATVNIGMAAFLWILMPIFAAATTSGGEGMLLINPAYQTAVTMEGCYNNNMHWSSSNSGGRAFDWYDEMISASEHAVRLLITLMAALFVVLFALMISAKRIERPDRSR